MGIRYRFSILASWIFVLTVGGGLAQSPVYSAAEEPLAKCDLPQGANVCQVCRESITTDQVKFAAYIPEGKRPRGFHDIGSMLTWRNEQCMSTTMDLDANLIVRDYDTCEEVEIGSAFFLVRTGIETPHGKGIVAFKTREAAEKHQAEIPGSEVMDYETLLDQNFKDIMP